MRFGVLADLFGGVGTKVVTQNELAKQHEFQGVKSFRQFLGEPRDKIDFEAEYLWISDDPDDRDGPVLATATWADVRRNDPKRSAEYRLYYDEEVRALVRRAEAGSQLVVAKRIDGRLLFLLSPAGSTIGQQLLWLFGLDLFEGRSVAKRLERDDTVELGLAARNVLADLGIEVEEPEPDAFGLLIERFGREFPGTVPLSLFARETLTEVNPLEDPDGALIAWMEHEEALFRHLEREIVSDRLEAGFMEAGMADVDGFLSFSLSVQNRRKSRAGYAFGHHVEAILQAHGVNYTREATTEKRAAADFLFPGADEYADRRYPDDQLAMLAVKTSCKDRWRQVLTEADRIRTKHLLTLEPAISRIQTAEMHGVDLQLVLPSSLHDTYQPDQRAWLMGVGDFLATVRDLRRRQRSLI